MQCEKCRSKHDGSYGSGRFCSASCARSFSTCKDRPSINSKISGDLKGRNRKYKSCPVCGSQFFGDRATCSPACAKTRILESPGSTGRRWKVVDSSKMGGIREGGGRSKLISYTSWSGEEMKLNKEEILVAEILDRLRIRWTRNWAWFPYTTQEGDQRKFYPDFHLLDSNIYLEYKGFVTDKMWHKMQDARTKTDFKLIIVVPKRYEKYGILLGDLETYLRREVQEVERRTPNP